MSNVIIDDTYLNNIANAIRSKNKLTDKYKTSEMSIAINELEEISDYIDATKTNNETYLSQRLMINFPKLDTSQTTTLYYAFQRCSNLKSLQELDAGKITNIEQVLGACISLEFFGGFKDLGKSYLTTAVENYSKYTLNLVDTILNHESLMNVINKVYDIKSLGIASQTIRIKTITSLSDEEIAIATSKGWNITE